MGRQTLLGLCQKTGFSEVEKPLLGEVLEHCQGNLTHAAEVLGMNRATLRKKLDEYNIAH